jgi:hypothetical protein
LKKFLKTWEVGIYFVNNFVEELFDHCEEFTCILLSEIESCLPYDIIFRALDIVKRFEHVHEVSGHKVLRASGVFGLEVPNDRFLKLIVFDECLLVKLVLFLLYNGFQDVEVDSEHFFRKVKFCLFMGEKILVVHEAEYSF